MLGITIRLAQRMGIHSESLLAKCTVLEAEMRRRLWWSLVLFDNRIGETANSKTTTLNPTWDCKTPLNVNDSDLRSDMKVPPAVQGKSTEALFAVVRSELGDYIRHTAFHLDYTSPALKPIAKHLQNDHAAGGELATIEGLIENRYLQWCDPENPIHFLTIWAMRAFLAKCRLLEHHSRLSGSSMSRTEAQRYTATSLALRTLECDTKIMTSPLTKRFLWLNHLYFPFPAYLQILQDLRRRANSERAHQAWETMSDNYVAWFGSHSQDHSAFFHIFINLVLQAWEACEQNYKLLGQTFSPPRIVSAFRHYSAQTTRHARHADREQPNDTMSTAIDNLPLQSSMDFTNQTMSHPLGMQDNYPSIGSDMYAALPGQAPLDVDMDTLDWTMFGVQPGWGGY